MTTITDKAMLARLKIQQWQATKHDKKISNEIANRHGARADMGKYMKQLMAREHLVTIREIATEARHHHYENTLPWLDDGVRILPVANYFDYMAEQNRLRDKFQAAVAKFVAAYPQLREEAKRELNGLFDPKDYPAESRIGRMFSMNCDIDPMPSQDDFRVNLSAAETRRIRDALQGRLDAAVGDAVNSLWERIFDVTERMVDRLRAYGTDENGKIVGAFRDSLIGNVRELVELLPKLNVTQDNRLADLADRIARDLASVEPAELRENEALRKEVAAKAEAIMKEVKGFME